MQTVAAPFRKILKIFIRKEKDNVKFPVSKLYELYSQAIRIRTVFFLERKR